MKRKMENLLLLLLFFVAFHHFVLIKCTFFWYNIHIWMKEFKFKHTKSTHMPYIDTLINILFFIYYWNLWKLLLLFFPVLIKYWSWHMSKIIRLFIYFFWTYLICNNNHTLLYDSHIIDWIIWKTRTKNKTKISNKYIP